MSDNTNKSDVLMQPIVIPTIGDAGYADSLNEAFDTINKNFVKLSNHDFVKGDAGVSVKIADYKFFNEDGTLTVFGERLKEFIVSMAKTPAELADIKDTTTGETVCSLFDYFYHPDNQNDSLKMICEWDETEVDPILSPVTSLYYVFMDGRYMSKALSEYEKQYENTKDFSCILVYDVDRETGEGKFSSLNNAFPTVYYEKGIGLCWKINGAGSGLPIRGIPGKDGANATLYIVRSGKKIQESTELGKPTTCNIDWIYDPTKYNEKYKVTGVYESYEGFIPVEDIEDIMLLDNQSALILGPNEDAENNTFYFGRLAVEIVETETTDESGNPTVKSEQKLVAYCSSDTSITTGIDDEAFINSMKRINLLDNGNNLSSGIKGLFIPLQKPVDNKQKVHLLTASSITNTEGISNDLKSDILWTPVADINSLEVNFEKPLEIDKYLYVKVNQDYDTIKRNYDKEDSCPPSNPLISGTSYVLKYKLENILSGGADRNSLYFDEYSIVKNGQGSRYYGKYYDDAENPTDLYESNTVVLTDSNTESSNHFDSMPEEFKSRLDSNAGIYRWVLCDEVHPNWDVDELLSTITGNIDDAKTYGFDKRFNVVFTTDLTPGEGTQIMWFDGTSFKASERTPSKFIVPGWITNKRLQSLDEGDATDYIFKFVKFVPIYNIDNTTQIDTDTALNINYNVNITGDNNNSKRSLSVHGDINCDTISVYKLTATGEIDNIYTRHDIVGDAGIKLAKNIDADNANERPYLFNVDGGSGDVTTDGQINASKVISSETKVVAPIIESPSIINITEDATGNIASNMYKLLGNTHREDLEYDNTKLVATVESYAPSDHNTIDTNKMYRDRLKINLVDTGIIDIKKRDLQLDRSNFDPDGNDLNEDEFPATEQVSKILTDTPIISHGKSSIVITDDVPSNVFVADVHTAAIHKAFQSFADNDVEDFPVGGQMIDRLFDKPNSYIVNKQIINKKHGNTSVVSKIVDFKDRSATIKDPHTDNGAQYDSICYYNPSPSTSVSKSFTYDSNSIITEINITPSDGTNIELDATERITITLPKLKFGFGLYAHCSHGKWTMLKSASMTLKYKIQSINTATNAVSNIDTGVTVGTYNFPDSNKYWTGGAAKYTQKGGNVANDNYETWRFKAYEFNPKDITISASNMSKIKSAFDKKETIQIIFWPEFNVNVTSEGGNKKLADDIMILRLRPIGNSSKSGSITTSSNYVSTINLSDVYTRCYYRENTVGMASDKDTSTNILCTDGLIVDANNYVFGLGLGMYGSGKGQHLEPELYFGYHDTTNNNAYKEQSISLNDLFAKLKTITL